MVKKIKVTDGNAICRTIEQYELEDLLRSVNPGVKGIFRIKHTSSHIIAPQNLAKK